MLFNLLKDYLITKGIHSYFNIFVIWIHQFSCFQQKYFNSFQNFGMHQRGQEINSEHIQMTTRHSCANLILVCTLLIGTKLVDT